MVINALIKRDPPIDARVAYYIQAASCGPRDGLCGPKLEPDELAEIIIESVVDMETELEIQLESWEEDEIIQVIKCNREE